MSFSVSELASLAGVSRRTLHYYDEIGLLSPKRAQFSKYRLYGEEDVERLQQIMFYRQFDFSLEEIREVLCAENYNACEHFEKHLSALLEKKKQIDALINNVQKTISSIKGEIFMSNKEKFEGFKKNLIDENEKKYGKEIREKYGDEEVNASNAKMMNMSEEDYAKVTALSNELNEKLKQATLIGDAKSALAMEVAELHRKWLCYFWKEYSVESHIGLVNMYCEDERFREYYEKITPGAAEFIRDAVTNFCNA